MDPDEWFARIQMVCFPHAALGVPLPSDLLGLHARSRRTPRHAARSVDGPAPSGALPSVSARRVRSCPVTGFSTELWNARISKRRQQLPGAAAQERNVDGNAAAARIPPDGRGDVRNAALVQAAGAAARAEEDGAQRF